MQTLEDHFKIPSNYLDVNEEVTPSARAMLVDWLIQVQVTLIPVQVYAAPSSGNAHPGPILKVKVIYNSTVNISQMVTGQTWLSPTNRKLITGFKFDIGLF